MDASARAAPAGTLRRAGNALRTALARANLVLPLYVGRRTMRVYARERVPGHVAHAMALDLPRLEPYAALARGWHDHAAGFLPRWAGYVRALLRAGDLGGDAALDLACGTGLTAASLARLFRRVHALDASPHMLGEARRRLAELPNVRLAAADFRSFSLEERVDLVVCSGDSLNYVAHADELAAVFERVAAALRPGGLFLFDLQAEDAFRWSSRTVFHVRTPRVEWIQVHAYDPASRVDDSRAVTAEGVESHRRVYLSPGEVTGAAGRAGLRVFERLDTPFLRWLGQGGGRDFYAYRLPG